MTRLRKISPPAPQDPIVLQKYNMKRADIALIIAQAARFTTLCKRDTIEPVKPYRFIPIYPFIIYPHLS
ncbi:hypothetical protein, partial [Mitsuokella multacida]|uniref:hypothetical protein n=1 Tax=Mitsuokella multacida TaxID=52226 RepID=UPI002432702F